MELNKIKNTSEMKSAFVYKKYPSGKDVTIIYNKLVDNCKYASELNIILCPKKDYIELLNEAFEQGLQEIPTKEQKDKLFI